MQVTSSAIQFCLIPQLVVAAGGMQQYLHKAPPQARLAGDGGRADAVIGTPLQRITERLRGQLAVAFDGVLPPQQL